MLKLKENKGITLIALVITIIVLLILAGITISQLAENGLFNKTQIAKETYTIEAEQEQLELEIANLKMQMYADNSESTISLNDLKAYLESDKFNGEYIVELFYEPLATTEEVQTTPVYAKVTHVPTQFVFYVDGKLIVIGAKVEVANNNNTSVSGSVRDELIKDVGNVTISISNISSNEFKINVSAENPEKIALYQYYVSDELLYEGRENTYTVKNLRSATKYTVEVKVVPKSIISVGTVEQETEYAPKVLLAERFDKYIYIDSANGNDSTGDGTINSPYKTLDKIAGSGIIQNGYTYGIILKNGTYNLTDKIYTLTCNKSINLIGNKQNTILKVGGLWANSRGGSSNYTINFYRLIWDGKNTTDVNTIATNTIMNMYSVVFINIANNSYSYFCPYSAINLYNCTKDKSSSGCLRTTQGTIQLTNCYGGWTSGYGTQDSKWNYQTNRILSTYTLGSKYTITEAENLWKNVGTGTNLDETQANLGVYGGSYSWEYEDDIF